MNPLIEMMARQANGNNPMMGMMTRFAEFRKQWTPQTARAKIDEMVRTGQVSPQQVEQARQMAEKFGGMMK